VTEDKGMTDCLRFAQSANLRQATVRG
jgi:hypothetical protein